MLLLLYVGYIFFMMNNDRFKAIVLEKFKILEQEAKNILPESGGGVAKPHDNKAYGFLSKKGPIPPSQSGYSNLSAFCFLSCFIKLFILFLKF